MIAILVLIGIFICGDIITTTAADAMNAEEKKAELQEQLAEELREYYIGGDNWQECNRLIQQIEELNDLD